MFTTVCSILFFSAALGADDPAATEFFEKEIRPLLVEKCQTCHNATKTSSGLKLLDRDSILKGGERGPAIVPGKVDESLLLQAINYGGELKMPPKGKLADAEIAKIQRWIELGAPWPATRQGSGLSTLR